MTSEERRAKEFCVGIGYFAGSIAEEELVAVLRAHAKEQRETVAAWMIHRGYATGHGDTIEDLLQELGEQIDEYKRTHVCVPAISVSEKDEKIVDKMIRDNMKHRRTFPIGEKDE